VLEQLKEVLFNGSDNSKFTGSRSSNRAKL